MAIYNISAGHNPDGKVACGAVGLIQESTEARAVKNLVISKLQSLGHTVYDCTVDNGKSQSDVLQQIVKKCNAHKVDLDVSIHFNSGANDKSGNGKTTGTEVLVYSSKSASLSEAKNIVNAISALGFKNRGIKYRTDLYFLRKTTSPALLIECCFVDDKDDVNLYSAETMATAIVRGITGQTVAATKTEVTTEATSSFKVKIIVDELNYRAGAGTSYKAKGSVKKGEVYTITETSGNWGKLKSGAGWINISSAYVVRM